MMLVFLAQGSVESTHKVPTSHYRTKHCHAAAVPLGGGWTNTPVRIFKDTGPPPPFQTYYIYHVSLVKSAA